MCSDEIRINFNSKDDNTCSTSLFNSDDDMELSAWPPNIIIGENKFTARLGPSGGVRGYMSITGKKFHKYFIKMYKHSNTIEMAPFK